MCEVCTPPVCRWSARQGSPPPSPQTLARPVKWATGRPAIFWRCSLVGSPRLISQLDDLWQQGRVILRRPDRSEERMENIR
jgi:hypothetical protein